MSLVKKLAPHLPYLRRYARALTGRQESGDAYIRASLEALVASPDKMDAEGDPRVELYRFFHVVWGSTGAQLEAEQEDGDPATARLRKLAPIQRQAFLLTSLEGFSRPEASYILGVTEGEQAELERAAIAEIEAELSTKVLVIEDEPIIAADLESLVEELGHEVTGNATRAIKAPSSVMERLLACDCEKL